MPYRVAKPDIDPPKPKRRRGAKLIVGGSSISVKAAQFSQFPFGIESISDPYRYAEDRRHNGEEMVILDRE